MSRLLGEGRSFRSREIRRRVISLMHDVAGFVFPSWEDWSGAQEFGVALFGLVAIDDRHKEPRDRIRAVLQVGFIESHITMVLDVVVTSPPGRILAGRPFAPRFE